MFCNKCGTQIPDDAQFCPSCGAPKAGASNTVSDEQPYAAQAPQPQVPQGGNYNAPVGTSDYNTLGGWLLLFVVIFIIDAAYAIIASIVTGVQWSGYASYASMLGMGSLNAYIILCLIIGIAGGAVELYFVYLIFKRKNSFLKFYQILKIAMFVLYIILMIFGSGLSGYGIGSSSILSLVAQVVGLVLMTLYFCKSVRVRTYMHGTEYAKQALFRIGM